MLEHHKHMVGGSTRLELLIKEFHLISRFLVAFRYSRRIVRVTILMVGTQHV
jgi:hypothetical protein